MKRKEWSESTELALRERVKELSCLYGISEIAAQPGKSLEQMLQQFVELLPPAWQYPEITVARITLDGCLYTTAGFCNSPWKQEAEIRVGGICRGLVEVVYTENKSPGDQNPFLEEERHLINAVANKVALIVERREAELDKLKLQNQLRHADRLATIGQLTAGVAHELNEPLGNILGFAQLAKKHPDLPLQVEEDLLKIESAALHAREIIKNLMAFTRQIPTSKTLTNLNRTIEEGLFFIASRCAKSDVELKRSLALDLPEIAADPAQLNQVLVNLAVNALHAMPEGGTLTIQTLADDEHVYLVVGDTGEGMSKEILDQVFIPFFTTKEVGQGTGLGLPVVQGIVSSHGGTIEISSEVGRGSRFEIKLPRNRK